MADGTIVKRASVSTEFFNHKLGSEQEARAKNFRTHGREVRPIAGLRRRSFWHDAGNHLVSLPKFHSLAGTEPSLQPFGIPKLANVYAGHANIVPQYVTQCQRVLTGPVS